ncbi:MAG: cysteine--tRNA ligase, partial [Oscillospiraceae bacterium]|nr:cysteine--tRNA ligase [Oscillospiraceae bacterium]
YRFFCLQSHYRKSLVFSWENLDNAKLAYEKLAAKIAGVLDGSGDIDEAKYAELKKKFTDAMDNDLNTALAVTAVYDVLKADVSNAAKLALIKDFDKVLSLGLITAAEKASAKSEGEESLPEEVAALAEQRKAARKEKNFALADELRDKITALGYVITETREGTKITKK